MVDMGDDGTLKIYTGITMGMEAAYTFDLSDHDVSAQCWTLDAYEDQDDDDVYGIVGGWGI